MKIEEALKIKNSDIAKYLKLPPVKLHCSMLAEEAIKKAIEDVKTKNNVWLLRRFIKPHSRSGSMIDAQIFIQKVAHGQKCIKILVLKRKFQIFFLVVSQVFIAKIPKVIR